MELDKQISCLPTQTNQTNLPCRLIMLLSYGSRQKVMLGVYCDQDYNPLPLLFIPGVSKIIKKIKVC